MEIQDFAPFAIFALFSMPTFWIVRFVLKRTGWDQRKRLFLDAWKVWLTWLISSGLSYLLLLIIADSFRFARIAESILVVVPFMIIVDFVLISVVVKAMVRLDDESNVSIADNESHVAGFYASVWRTSLLVSLAGTLTLFSMFGIAALASDAYNRLYPPPPNQFGIYDIS